VHLEFNLLPKLKFLLHQLELQPFSSFHPIINVHITVSSLPHRCARVALRALPAHMH